MQPQNGREIAPQQQAPADVLERIIIHGDLSKLSPAQEVEYIRRMCDALGISYLTRPFAMLTLNGKRVLYALRDCTDQLRKVHGVSVIDTRQEEIDGVYIVVAKVQDKNGRTDTARGAVNIGGLKAEALANAIMKAETKAKRRATLSITGLGVLDETEIEDVKAEPKRKSSSSAKKDGTDEVFNEIRAHIAHAANLETLEHLKDAYAQELADMPTRWAIILSQEFEHRWSDLGGDASDCPYPAMEDQG